VGGDFYDIFETGAGSWAIIVGDVCGKGPEAAAVTALARYTIREAAIHERRPSGVLTLLSNAIRRQRPANEFCTVAYVDLGLDGDRADVTFSTGGHPLPLLLRAGGRVHPVGHHGVALGIDPDPNLVDHRIELHRGDALLLYTDGLTDAYAPAQPLGPRDLASLLASFHGRPAAEIADGIHDAVLGSASAEPRDDVAIVVLRISV
jgi:serine phosphatase RsbU (regulator of sigma subunit)